MRKPRAFAPICLLGVAATTTTSVLGFHTGGVRCARPNRLLSRRGSSSTVQTRGWGPNDDSGSTSTSTSKKSNRCAPPPLGCAAPEAGEEDNYGSSDYSEYGYEPEYELQGEPVTSDKETLEKWRLERLLVNDKWQFGKYGKQNVGNWLGSWKEYVAQELRAGDDADVGAMIGIVPGGHFVANTRVTRRVLKYAEDTKVFEHEQSPAGEGNAGDPSCPSPVVETLFTDSFRGGNGTQVVGNAYTMAEARPPTAGAAPDDSGDVWVEVGLRAKDLRIRCVFQYGRGATGASVRRIFLVREGLERLPPEDGTAEPELYGSAGKGLYDAPSLSRSPYYFSIYAEGGLTIRFPLTVEAGQGGVISVDWTAGDVRYQADRVFDVLDGSCRRLEVTEIGTEDAEKFLPMEKF